MPNALVATTFKQPTGITASSERSGHPAFNLISLTKWRRTWRSLDITTQTLVFDFGATTTLAGIFLNNVNFSAFTLDGSANGTTWTSVGSLFGANDDRVGRQKSWNGA